MNLENVIIGTKLTMQVRLEPMGDQHMVDYAFECVFSTDNSRKLIIPKDRMEKAGEDEYIAFVDTSYLKPGRMKMRVHVMIPDGRFEGNMRDDYEDVYTDINLVV